MKYLAAFPNLLAICAVTAAWVTEPPYSFYVLAQVAQDAQHIKDPAKCTKVCVPYGYDKDLPDEYPHDATIHECKGTCSRARKSPPNDDPNHECKPHHTCVMNCSEVCCQCLAECV